jgi:hypothetical protein
VLSIPLARGAEEWQTYANGVFAPVYDEITSWYLPVTGAVPAELDGVFLALTYSRQQVFSGLHIPISALRWPPSRPKKEPHRRVSNTKVTARHQRPAPSPRRPR